MSVPDRAFEREITTIAALFTTTSTTTTFSTAAAKTIACHVKTLLNQWDPWCKISTNCIRWSKEVTMKMDLVHRQYFNNYFP